MFRGDANLTIGARVRVRSHSWTVHSVTEYIDCTAVRLSGGGTDGAERRTFLLPFDRVQPCETSPLIHVGGRRHWAHHVAQAFTSTHPFGGLRWAAAAAIDLLPYQLEPALAMLRHARLRILIADEVGLGKTIQAGIVLNELAQQDSGFRAIVVCPAGLREQWRDELASKFSLASTHADTAWLADCARDLPADINPWSLPGIYIASLDLLKRPEMLRGLADVLWDVAVIDEAHALGLATARLDAARAVAVRSRRLIVMTATPPDDDPRQLAAITELGQVPGEPPIAEFRRTRDDAGVDRHRRTHFLPVRLSEAEIRMHRLLERYTSLVWSDATARGDQAARLAAMVLRKRALSSAASLEHSVRRRLAVLGTSAPDIERQLLLPLGDEDPLADAVGDSCLAANGLSDVALERACLEEIAGAAHAAAGAESKIGTLARLLRRAGEPALVFTEYRDTLARIATALGSTLNVSMLHGELLPRERTEVQRAFNRSGSVLLATDAASEGLNLHERCRLVIHFELPWTPMRLEQRTGRVDRLGQTRPVHEVLLVARDTAERFVLTPLLRRARAAARRGSRRFAALDESAVAESVMEGAPVDDCPDESSVPTDWPDLRADAIDERIRLEAHRAFRARTKSTTVENDPVTTVSRSRPSQRPLAVILLSLGDPAGVTVHSQLVPLTVTWHEPLSYEGALAMKSWAARFLHTWNAAIAATVIEACRPLVERTRGRVEQLAAALSIRERAFVEGRPAARALVQTSLFDRRAVRMAASTSARSEDLNTETERRLRALDDSTRLLITTRVIGIRWPRR